ncbi:MAG: hypothetical protein GY823_12640, partial [Flavobacteriaceae bacterium]|nr:hypothetical protein [Flavobacteriaceae bacterium]
KMIKSIEQELKAHVIQIIEDQQLQSTDDLHFHAFNKNYYVALHDQAEQWLKKHDLTAWQAINTVQKFNGYIKGNIQDLTINPRSIVNLYIYIKGIQIIHKYDFF